MKLPFLFTLIILILISSCSQPEKINKKHKNPEILRLIGEMSLEEKIGQMQQVNGAYGNISEEFREAIQKGFIGSVLNEVDVNTRNEIQRIAVEESRLGIPIIFGRDVIHGFKTIFPIPLGQAASWNPEIAKEGARIAAKEAWSSGVNWTFAPMLDISRDARWGRIAESLGEDPYLASQFATAMVEGFQGSDLKDEGSILACAKHFAGYGAAEGGRDYNTTMIPEGELRDVYLPPFEAAKEAGAGSFMSGFNELNGVPATGNKFLLKKILRKEWGFQGFVVSDWASITEMIGHGFAVDEKDAAKKALEAGVDMEMATIAYHDHLKDLVKEGKVDEALIDEAVYRMLNMKSKLGLFDEPYVKVTDQNPFGKEEYLQVAHKAAVQSMVLLKNKDKLLPISEVTGKIAVIGPMAHQKYEQLGTWIFDGDTSLSITPLEGVQSAFGENKILFESGLDYSRSKDQNHFNKAIQAAKRSELVLLCMGEESIISGEAHCRANIELPGVQNELIKAISETGKPIVLLVMAGRPLAIGEISEYVDAIIYAFHPGTMGGTAFADLLTGVEIPSGKLPVTFPKSSGQIPFYYNRKNTGRPANPLTWKSIDEIPVRTQQTSLGNETHYLDLGHEALYPFGYGLSYTEYVYSDLSIENPEVSIGEDITASVTLENVGSYTGEEVVQLYIRDLVGDVTRPIKELKAFRRVLLKAGESTKISFKINTSELAFHNQKMEKVVEAGDFELWIGGSSKAKLKETFFVK